MSPVLSKPQQPQSAPEVLPTDGTTATGPTTPGPLASFVRFVVCGGGVGLLSGAAVPLLATLMPWALANAVITVASTLVCTELHALFTFGTGRRAGWRRHLQSAGSATAAYGVTCAAMFGLYALQSSPGLLTQQAVYLGAAALAGTGRFLVLRLFVFADGARKETAASTQGEAAAGPKGGTAPGPKGGTALPTAVVPSALTRPVLAVAC
ncbi:GtrA family protein [Streptomyces bobili]|uniref:hypothetical protein n=1 Tax=Streptomyces bobili TaxID=67280 RepID=UPI00224F64C3|nr:hypothetical protein [Streptomyces bobili]MCX5522125.1 GtrA family protein [Streptomyces bobili]